MRLILNRHVPPMIKLSTLLAKESYSMKILHLYLLLPPQETIYKIMMKIIMFYQTLVTLKKCLRIVNLSKKIATTACEPPLQKSCCKNLTQSSLLNKRPTKTPRSARTVKNARVTEIVRISIQNTQNLLTTSWLL